MKFRAGRGPASAKTDTAGRAVTAEDRRLGGWIPGRSWDLPRRGDGRRPPAVSGKAMTSKTKKKPQPNARRKAATPPTGKSRWRRPDKPGPKPKRSPPATPPPAEGRRRCPPVNGGGKTLEAKSSPLRRKWGEAARMLFVERGLSLQEIRRQELIPVGAATLGKWAQAGSWEQQRAIRAEGPQALVSDVLVGLRAAVAELRKAAAKGTRPKGLCDDILKLSKVTETLSGDAYFAGHLAKTLELLVQYCEVSGKAEARTLLADVLPGFTVWAMAGRH